MDLLTIFVIAVGLAMDAFAVSVTSGMIINRFHWRSFLKIAFFFGGFQALMPVIGWSVGLSFSKYIQRFDHWIAFGLLLILGIKMIYEGIKDGDEEDKIDPTKLGTLLVLSIATSIDALAIGISFACLNIDIVRSASIIGIVTFLISFIGVVIGLKFGSKFNFRLEIAGGVILVGIGLKILLQHLLS